MSVTVIFNIVMSSAVIIAIVGLLARAIVTDVRARELLRTRS